MNKESLYEKDFETLMNPCHTWKTILQPIKYPCRIRIFPKQAATSFKEKNPSQIGSPQVKRK
jgi:hypothetical protein